jgi:photosystem II stability/assembly factor-like uncharacterized protein
MLRVFLVASSTIQAVAQWTQTNFPTGETVFCFGESGNSIFAGTGRRLYISNDSGANWTVNLTSAGTFWSFASLGANLFVGTEWDGVLLSTNNGTSWAPVNTNLGSGSVYSLAFSGTTLFAATHYGRVCRSTNNGTNWTQVNSGLPITVVSRLFTAGTYLFAGTSNGVFVSTNNGDSWMPANSGLNDVASSFAAFGSNIFVGTDHSGAFLSTNNGATWGTVNSGLTDPRIRSLVLAGRVLFAGGLGGGVSASTDTGASWMPVNLGLMNTDVWSLLVSTPYLLAGNNIGTIWRRLLSEMTTAVQEISNDVPTQFYLTLNYPNPFNPVTTFAFTLPVTSFATIKVYDLVGEEVETLIYQELPPGTYTTQWHAQGLSSGVYFCQLQAGSFIQTRKLVLTK